MPDKRSRPWRKLRAVVEVTVPPTSRATEADLVWHIEHHMPDQIMLRRPAHANAFASAVRVKQFIKFLPAYLLQEHRKK